MGAQVTLQKRFQDTQCGCYKLEYDECVRTQHLNGCPLSTGAEDLTRFTCGPNERGCGVNHKDREEERAYHMKTACSTSTRTCRSASGASTPLSKTKSPTPHAPTRALPTR